MTPPTPPARARAQVDDTCRGDIVAGLAFTPVGVRPFAGAGPSGIVFGQQAAW